MNKTGLELHAIRLTPDKLIERVCELERELARVRAALEDDVLASIAANGCRASGIGDAQLIIDIYRAAVRERIKQ